MRISTAALLLTLCATTAVAAADERPAFDARLRYRVELAGAAALGPADAPVTIVEFSDFLCRYCGRAAETLSDLRLLYGDKLRVVYRHSLLDDEDGTLPAEAALAAAAQGRFWPYHDRLFAHDRSLDRAALEAYAAELGLDLARFRRDLDAGRMRPALARERAIAEGLGVSSTPMFFVNGRPIAGSQAIGVFVQVIDDELARAAALRARGVPAAEVHDRLTRGGATGAAILGPGAFEHEAPELDLDGRYAAGPGLPAQRQGRDDALVTLIEFGDYQCGYCGRAEPTLAALRAKYGDELRVVMRYSPLGGDGGSELIAEAALAAGEQGAFWRFHAAAFAALAAGRELGRDGLEALAAELGLDLARFGAALDQRRHRRAVLADAAEASRFGVRGTPSFFVNGRPLVGAQPQARFEALIDAELARARALLEAGTPRAALYERAVAAP